MSAILIALSVSLVCCLLLIRYQHLHNHVTGDTDILAIQKFHHNPVPRIGGLAIFIALAVALLLRWQNNSQVGLFAGQLLLAFPAFWLDLLKISLKKLGQKSALLRQ